MDLKKSSIGLGGITPGQLPQAAKPRPVMPAVATTPRDIGGMADGTTGGNFAQSSLTQLPNNATAAGTQAGVDQAQAVQKSYAND